MCCPARESTPTSQKQTLMELSSPELFKRFRTNMSITREDFQGIFQFRPRYHVSLSSQSFTLLKNLKYLDYRYHTKLRWVRIFFDTASFDKITKDDKAPFDVRLSSVGGTLGLLTGFSLISAMEILFFSSKLIIALLEKMTRKKSYEMKN